MCVFAIKVHFVLRAIVGQVQKETFVDITLGSDNLSFAFIHSSQEATKKSWKLLFQMSGGTM